MSFAPTAFPTLALFYQRLLNRMTYALRWYPIFNQWSPYSVSLHSNPAGSYRRPYPSPVDAQRLSRLRRFLRRLSSSSGCLIERLMLFASHPTFNQWSPCSASPHSNPAVSCRYPYSGPVDVQYLLHLWRSPRKFPAISR